ncbi:hypothetical protein DFH09DRAFT_1144256 [Mycena vulgaris]|nr:hypothetical protein DFH09DRAFT_1144256 [Mycena vulgaris]
MDSELSAHTLPLYSPSTPSPSYSQDPACDETRLESSLRTGRRPLPTGIFTKAYGSVTIVLFDQEPSARVPSYRKQASVRGTLILEQDVSNICEVTAKLEGQLETITAELGSQTIRTVKMTHSLWSPVSSSPCPGRIDFSCPFPATFQHGDRGYPLPPSYTARFPGLPSLFAKCTYNLTISIRRLGFLSKTKMIHVPLDYYPQTSPPRGISPTPFFLSAVKIMPEEWYQSSFVMNTRSSSNITPIECQAFIPSVKIFGLTDTIPLHLQTTGSLPSLRELILASSPAPGDADFGQSPVRVYLTRVVTVEYRGRVTWRVMRIGEGHFRPLPPIVNFDCNCQTVCIPHDSCVQSLDWDGEVKCNPNITIGGFQAAGLSVKDYITFEVIALKPSSSPLLTVQHGVPIRFVTETFFANT